MSKMREWNNCFIKYQTLDKISRILNLPTPVLGHFEGKFSVMKLSVSIFGKTAGYRIYTMSRKPIKKLNIQCLVSNKNVYSTAVQEERVPNAITVHGLPASSSLVQRSLVHDVGIISTQSHQQGKIPSSHLNTAGRREGDWLFKF